MNEPFSAALLRGCSISFPHYPSRSQPAILLLLYRKQLDFRSFQNGKTLPRLAAHTSGSPSPFPLYLSQKFLHRRSYMHLEKCKFKGQSSKLLLITLKKLVYSVHLGFIIFQVKLLPMVLHCLCAHACMRSVNNKLAVQRFLFPP